MALVLNEEQSMLKDAAAGFLAEKAPVSELRKLRDERSEDGFSRALWQDMAEMGWAGIAIPEAYGGLDYGYIGLGIILEEMGRHLTVSPLQSSVLVGATLINIAGNDAQKASLLPAIAEGKTLVSLALQEGRHHRPAQIAVTATADGDEFRLSGKKTMVLDCHVADKIVVAARTAGQPGDENGISLFLIDANASGVNRERVIMVDSRNAGNLILDNVAVTKDDLIGELNDGMAVLDKTLSIANVGLSAELLGLCLQTFEMTVEYLKQRKQFGVLIGSFQALQHRAADMFAELELCKSMVLASLQAIDSDADDLALMAAATKAKLCEVAEVVTNEGVQMHGGIGMTDEFDIGFFMKRARAAQQTFGDYSYQLDRFALLNNF